MTPNEFILKWEQEIRDAMSTWDYAAKKGWNHAELIEGARMQGIAKMIEEYYEAHKIMPPHIRGMKDVEEQWAKEGYINPEK